MIIESIPEMTLTEFAELHELDLVCSERPLPIGDPSRYYCRLKNIEVRGDGVLISTFGNGATPEEALFNAAKEYSLKRLIKHGNTAIEAELPVTRIYA